MKHCWSNGKTLGGRIAPVGLCIPVIFFVGILIDVRNLNLPLNFIFKAMAISLLFCGYFFFEMWVSERKYEITADGMYIKYPFSDKRFHRWSEFSEVALCKVHYAPRSNVHTLAIRCVIGQEESGPRCARVAKEDWSMVDYEYRHYKQIISIYYTEERYDEFQKLCPLPIKDYSHLRDI